MTNPAEDRTERSWGIERALTVARRRKWIALAALTAVLAAVVSLAMWLPPLYRATVTVLVESQQVSETFVQRAVTSELDTRLQVIRQELMSRARLGRLIEHLDLYSELRTKGGLDAAIEQMRLDLDLDFENVSRQTVRGPTIAFAISYSGRDPQMVARVANLLAEFYVDENTRMRSGQAKQTAEFLKAQLDEARKELTAQERRTTDYTVTHTGELPQQVEANLGSLERLNTQLRLNGDNQIRAMDRRDRLEEQLADLPSGPAPAAPSPSTEAGQLARLKQELSDLRRQYSDVYPDVIRVRSEIEALERKMAQTPAASNPSPAPVDPRARLQQSLGDVERELTALREEELALRKTIATYELRVNNAPRREQEFQILSQEYLSTKERHDSLLKRYEAAQLAESLERGQPIERFRVLDPAIPPERPAAPRRLRLIAAGLILAFLIAAGAVVAADKLDTSFHSLDDVRSALGDATVFSIPVISTAADTRRRWRRGLIAAMALMLGLGLIVAGSRYAAIGNERIVRIVSRV